MTQQYSPDSVEMPAHRVMMREVLAWANGLNGRAPTGEDIRCLMADLTRTVEDDRQARAAANAAQAASERLASAEKVIVGVVNSYPVAAGTSKYGYEEDHDGYGWIRECRLWLEAHAPSALPSAERKEADHG